MGSCARVLGFDHLCKLQSALLRAKIDPQANTQVVLPLKGTAFSRELSATMCYYLPPRSICRFARSERTANFRIGSLNLQCAPSCKNCCRPENAPEGVMH